MNGPVPARTSPDVLDLNRYREVQGRLHQRSVLSHETAARLHGIHLVAPGTERVTVPQSWSRCVLPDWEVHRFDLRPADVVVRRGLRTTSVLRTVVDVARVLPLAEAVAAADSALHQELVTNEQLARLHLLRGRGAGGPRQVAALADSRAESVLESLLRLLCREAGLPPPELQYALRDARGREVARVDLCWPQQRLIVEADGYAFHSDRHAYRRDRERWNAATRLQWRTLRFTYEDVRSRPEYVCACVLECWLQL